MLIDKENAKTGDGLEILLDDIYRCTVIERIGDYVRVDYINRYGCHKRDQWIEINKIQSCRRSDIDEITRQNILSLFNEVSWERRGI
jgi:hypothetical protein